MFDAHQCRSVNNGLHLAWVHRHLPVPHDMAQVFNLRPTKLAFGMLNTELVLVHMGKHCMQVSQVLSLIGTEHQQKTRLRPRVCCWDWSWDWQSAGTSRIVGG